MTTFLNIAIILPKPIRKQLQRLCYGLPNVTWSEEENLHLTLLSAGPNLNSLDIDIHEKLIKIDFKPLTLSIQGVHCHKSNEAAGTLWAGVQESIELAAFLKSIDAALKDILPPKSKNGLKAPHITLGRYERADALRLSEYLAGQSDFLSTPFSADHFVLLEGHRTKDHTLIYTEIARYKGERVKAKGER